MAEMQTLTYERRDTRRLMIGTVPVGAGAPITVQSMTNTKTQAVTETVEQISRLTAVGCDLVRLAVPDGEAAKALAQIKLQVQVPLIADIHFDYRLA